MSNEDENMEVAEPPTTSSTKNLTPADALRGFVSVNFMALIRLYPPLFRDMHLSSSSIKL